MLVTVLAILFSSFSARAAIQIPKNLSAADRVEAVKILGLGTSSKILSDPYPLGGYAGFELGISVEDLPTEDIGRLGSGLSSPQQDIAFPEISIGKGLYNNLDLFFQFTPYNRQDELSQYGAIARWGFFQATFLPLSASVLVHVNTGNVGNFITTRSYGADLIGGINVEDISLFAGIGMISASGTFIGGDQGITDSQQLETESASALHTVIGGNIRIQDAFIAMQIDRYATPVMSVKTGYRW